MQTEGRDRGAKRRKNVFEEIEKAEDDEISSMDKMAKGSTQEESKMLQLEEEVRQLKEVCNGLL